MSPSAIDKIVGGAEGGGGFSWNKMDVSTIHSNCTVNIYMHLYILFSSIRHYVLNNFNKT